MKPRITVVTLGVDDLERSLRFYRDGLCLKSEGLRIRCRRILRPSGRLKLALWPRKSLAHDSGLAPGKPSATEFSLGHHG
jgi:uncharacterized protein